MLPGHSNGMRFEAYGPDGTLVHQAVMYSVGGGFIATARDLAVDGPVVEILVKQPHAFTTAAEMLAMGRQSGLSIAAMVLANECVDRDEAEVRAGILRIWDAMKGCIDRGIKAEGSLPGSLKVRRRAAGIHRGLLNDAGRNAKLPHECIDWVSLWAIAVNEENAAGGRIVTAPTNGAAGVIPRSPATTGTISPEPPRTRWSISSWPPPPSAP